MRNKPSSPIGFIVLLLLLLAALPAFAQDSLDSIPKTLTLKVGETYTFQNKLDYPLFYNSTDDTIISINEAENQITALKSGNVRLFIESFDSFSFATCDVTISGSQAKDAVTKRSGESFINLSKEDQKKIYSEPLLSYLSFIRESDFTEQTFESAAEKIFYLVADVTPGTEQAQSERALSLGMLVSEPLEELNSVTLMGTFKQILTFTANNPDLLSVFGGNRFVLDDPVSDEDLESIVEKAVRLEGSVENLTKISVAHNKGYKGKGMTVAILDTGIRREHEQFSGRVVAESCRSNGGVSSKTGTYRINGRTYNNIRFTRICSGSSSAPILTSDPSNYNHGSHVAGIAAGKDGIAPEANIIAVNVFSEISGYNVGKGNTVQDADVINAFNDLLKWNKTYKIAAVNMSFGMLKSDSYMLAYSTCDSNKPSIFSKFKALVSAGIVPVKSAGNDAKYGAVSYPGCYSNVFTVGALNDSSTIGIPNFSNEHKDLVNIFAPGCQIRSSIYTWESGASCADGRYGSKNCYAKYSGTSMAAPMVTGAFAILKQAYPNMTPAQLESQMRNMSTRTVTGYRNRYTQKILDFTNFNPFNLSDSNIRGKNKEIQIVIPWKNTGRTDFSYTIYDDSTNQRVYPTYKIRDDANKINKIVTFTGSSMVNGKVYRMELQVKQNGRWSQKLTKYGMPIPNVFGATVVAMNKTMVINNQHREPTSGTRYMIFDANTEKELAYQVGTRNETTWSYDKLTNGKLYYAVAVPYRDYKGQRLWGPNENRIYFIPMSAPGDGNVSFSGSNASVSIRKDSDAEGIRVLYRTVGGKLQNGCEGKGNKCTISGLNKNTAYEFYAMKYKTAKNKKYYSMGILIPYKTAGSGLKAPQSNPVVTMTNSGYTKFSIKLASNAQGISVLYREGEGAFKQACEKAGNTCDTNLNVKSRYTFYIMQYRTVNGKKLYSNGIIARDFSSMKNGEYERVYNNFYLADESILQEEIAAALDDYLTEDAMLMAEAMEAMSGELMAKSAEEYDYGFIEDDSWIEEYARFDSDVMAEMIEKQAVPEAQPEEKQGLFSWPNLIFLGGDDTREAPVPSFENK